MNSYVYTSFPKCYMQTVSGAGSDRIGKHAAYAHFYPNFFINRYGPWFDTNTVFPTSEEECMVRMEWFVEKKYLGDKDYVEKSLKDSELVQHEDVFLCENVMKGLKSDAYEAGRYVPLREIPAYHFHVDLHKDLCKGLFSE